MLELKNISKTYKNARKKDFEAIKNISFYINKKEVQASVIFETIA